MLKPRTPSHLQVFESLPLSHAPQGWTKIDRPATSTRLRLRIALQEPDQALFEQTLFEISDPDHAKYGQHLERDEVKALIKPRNESTNAVMAWLQDSGIVESDIDNDSEWINFFVPVSKAEEMMNTTFNYFTQDADKTATKKIRALQYSVPLNVAAHITMIQPTTRFGGIMTERSTVFDTTSLNSETSDVLVKDKACSHTIVPECLRSIYNIGDFRAHPGVGSRFGVAGYLDQYAKYDALHSFLDEYAPYAKSQNFTYVRIAGGMNTQNDTVHDDGEANLDMQYSASLGFKQDIVYYSTGGLGQLVPDLDQPDMNSNGNEPYLDFLEYILGLDDHELPQTITTSYGENEQSVPEAYSRKVCNMFGELGMRGVSVIFSSGDTGVGSACQTNDGKNTTRFNPVFPAACPYVTSVGATKSYPEEAVDFSSGGFSDRFPRPSYQEHAVKEFLTTLGDKWKGLYNPDGRGFPDVAASGVNYAVKMRDRHTGRLAVKLLSGTSASAPTFAAIISLLNNARLQVGEKPLGFLNPWLYSKGKEGLNDVSKGGSTGCTGESTFSNSVTPIIPFASWNATKGWDPVTGLGTPDFEKLLKISTPKHKLPTLGDN